MPSLATLKKEAKNIGLIKTSASIKSKINDEILNLKSVMTEDISASSSVATHAVEGGENISDHVSYEPEQISIKTVFSDTSLLGSIVGAGGGVAGIISGAQKKDLLSVGSGAFGVLSGISKLSEENESVAEKIALLQKFHKDAHLLIYSGSVFSHLFAKAWDIYLKDMVITSLNLSRNPETGSGVLVSVTLKHIRIAEAQIKKVNLPQIRKPKKTKNAKKVKQKVSEKKEKSFLKSLFGSGSGSGASGSY